MPSKEMQFSAKADFAYQVYWSFIMTSIINQTIEYSVDGSPFLGYLAWDEEILATRPGIIVIHEWWGINDYIRRRADMLAEIGYCALAIDMYGVGQVAETPAQAGALMNSVLEDMDVVGIRRLEAGYQQLLNQAQVNSEKTAVIGYCFGGAMSLHMALTGMPLKAVTSFHGTLGFFHRPSRNQVQAQILVCHGGCDTMVSMEDVNTFKEAMNEAGVNYEVVVYENALHGFTNQEADENKKRYGLPLGYDAAANHASWQSMKELFNKHF